MVEGRELTLSSLSMDELAGVLNRYPWYGGAHMELCRRMVRSGGGSWGVAQYAGEALHIVSRRAVADLVRRSRDEDWSDLDVEKILKSYISAPAAAPQPSPVYERKVSRGPVPGDYFSQEAYAEVSREEDRAELNGNGYELDDVPLDSESDDEGYVPDDYTIIDGEEDD